ncbi:hypothetical protein ACLOJK_011749 [Asimina triloba]
MYGLDEKRWKYKISVSHSYSFAFAVKLPAGFFRASISLVSCSLCAEQEEKTRMLWFAVGFSVAGAAISHLVWKDLLSERSSISYQLQMKHQFDALEARISKLESVGHQNVEAFRVCFSSGSLCI